VTSEQLRVWYGELEQLGKVRFLIELSHHLTLIARDAYSQSEIKKPELLIKANEFQHRLSRMAVDTIDGTIFMNDGEVAEYLLVGFGELGETKFLEESLKRVPPSL
jgi:hypothetical protein